ncbi:MAG TPA: aminotransferase class I/II-fold pyridoxal phosphate-dependent enzyme [Candidatus Baltobacteraceae bacterium]|nr:aminotransferase class I/II-fold pyridoxal phosphate-dependent enzyme [Candidatus Baltobacteraceae bacterium]
MPNQSFGHSHSQRGFATRAIRSGQDPCSATGSTIVPVYQTATFTLSDVGVTKDGFDYSRTANPTRRALETQLADLEGAAFGCAFGSGMAAIAGAASLLRAGDHIVATLDIYGGTHRFFTQVLSRYGITTTFVDMCDLQAVQNAIRQNTKLFWIETPTNPILKIVDIKQIASLKRPGQVVVVDNTLCSPFLQQPLALGADIVVHSTTKYICGHSDVVGGIVVTDDPELHKEITFHQNAVGAIPGPWDAYLTLRGAKTLALRMRAHEANAFALANYLALRDDVAQVYYPGLPSHPQHELARSQMKGFGGIVSARLRGGAQRARAVARSTQIFNLATSLGGVESLVCVPATMTHASLTDEERADLGITDDLLRFSAGIENRADILSDVARALDSAQIPQPVAP